MYIDNVKTKTNFDKNVVISLPEMALLSMYTLLILESLELTSSFGRREYITSISS